MSRRLMIETLLRNAEEQVADNYCPNQYRITPEYDILEYINGEMPPEEEEEPVASIEPPTEPDHQADMAEEDQFVSNLMSCGLSSRNAWHIKMLIKDLNREQKEAFKSAIMAYM